jgi:RimJ/RimL family protein N-acetyltransferase
MTHSTRIHLAPLLDSDISEEYLETLNDAAYMKYSRNSGKTHTSSSQSRYISEFSNSYNLLFGLWHSDSGKLLGTINCYVDFSKMTLDIGFLVFKNHRGKGYASEGLSLFLDYLGAQFPGMTVVIGSNKENLAMHKVARNLDFHLETNAETESNENYKFVRLLPKLNNRSVPTIPDFFLKAKTIGLAAHDAGGAEQITWLMRNLPAEFLAHINGPAKKIFEDSGVTFSRADELSEIMESEMVITGSGWMSRLEVTAINEAKMRAIPCITILDHWVNYPERFKPDANPHILAVTNHMALHIAQAKFPNAFVVLLPDFQIQSYQEALSSDKNARHSILVLLEPISIRKDDFYIDAGVLQDMVRGAVSLMNSKGLVSIVIRPHPSQIEDRPLLDSIKHFSNHLQFSTNASLLDDLRISAAVIGLNSYAMYISAMCGIETYSCFAGVNSHWTQRYSQISTLPNRR